jgi:hypothetical protein
VPCPFTNPAESTRYVGRWVEEGQGMTDVGQAGREEGKEGEGRGGEGMESDESEETTQERSGSGSGQVRYEAAR